MSTTTAPRRPPGPASVRRCSTPDFAGCSPRWPSRRRATGSTTWPCSRSCSTARTPRPGWRSTTAARVAPIIVGGPFGGVLADRFDRRRLMVASDLVRAACMVGLAAVAMLGLPILLAPLLAGLATAASTPYPPCVAATTPRLVPAEVLPAANAARSAIGSLCIVAGPGFGAVLLLLGSTTLAFVVNAATFVVSAVLVLSLPSGELFAVERSGETARGVVGGAGRGRRARCGSSRSRCASSAPTSCAAWCTARTPSCCSSSPSRSGSAPRGTATCSPPAAPGASSAR